MEKASFSSILIEVRSKKKKEEKKEEDMNKQGKTC